MNKVLIISYYWTPAGGVAVQRWLKFSKYLAEYGWQPVILTVENGSYPYIDESLAAQVPSNIKVYRTKTFEPFELYNLLRGKRGKAVPLAVATASKPSLFQRLSAFIRANFFIPDARRGWIPYAVHAAENIIKEEGIDLIVTTGPPHSTHLIGQQLKAKYKLPWVADFRDPWTEIFNNQYLPFTAWAKNKDKQLEYGVLNDCDIATVIGEGMKSAFPAEFSHKMRVITNGYDEDDFDRTIVPAIDKYRMSYVGNLFSNQDLPALWEAIAALRAEHEDFKRDFELELIGKADPIVLDSMKAAGMLDCVVFGAFVPHRKAIAKMQSAAILLSVIPQVANNNLILTGKIFEYIGAGRPILLVGPIDCDAAKLIAESNTGVAHHYTDTALMKKTLLHYYKLGLNTNDSGDIAMYSRKSLTKKMAEVLEGLGK